MILEREVVAALGSNRVEHYEYAKDEGPCEIRFGALRSCRMTVLLCVTKQARPVREIKLRFRLSYATMLTTS